MKALHIVDDALHVSVSQVKTWLRCPRQYELRYVRGAEPEVVPTALAFGSAFHGALAARSSHEAGSLVGPVAERLVLGLPTAAQEHFVLAREVDGLSLAIDERGQRALHHERSVRQGRDLCVLHGRLLHVLGSLSWLLSALLAVCFSDVSLCVAVEHWCSRFER